MLSTVRSNRTIVGLKDELVKSAQTRQWGSNRTIVGLKVKLVSDDFCLKQAQQSHHCGIESLLCPASLPCLPSSSNRTIVGLKDMSTTCAKPWKIGSNRTIVGLKGKYSTLPMACQGLQQSHHCGIERLASPIYMRNSAKQQSHHCGIETTITGAGAASKNAAAIAPLWD